MTCFPDLEENVRRTGREIFARMGGHVPALFDKKRWTGRIMEWAMKDEDVKVRLFRFVDVLPALKSHDLVIRLLNEYFADVENTPVLRGLGLISARGFIPHVAARLIRSNVESMARQFIAGAEPQDAFPSLNELRKEGLAVTVDLLGEAVLSDPEASRYIERYMGLLEFLGPKVSGWPAAPLLDRDHAGMIPRLDVSLKVSSFYSQLDPIDWDGSVENAKAGLRSVLGMAEKVGASITFDMEHYYLKDLTIAVFLSCLDEFPDFPFVGIALQAYLKDTREDLLQIIKWAKKRGRRIHVRLTKGAYWDYETVVAGQTGWPIPVFQDKAETDTSFEELTQLLFQNEQYVRPAIATHNIRSIAHAVAVADHLKLPREAYEFQMIYGMAEPVRSALRDMRFRVRIYTPIGELIPGMAYLIRRLLENTSNESFLRKSFTQDKTPEELTEPPRSLGPAEKPGIAPDTFENEPPTNFSQAGNRDRMTNALKSVTNELNRKYPLLIGGKKVRTEHEMRSVNPARPEEIVGTVCSAAVEHAQIAIEEARRAWKEWRRTRPEKRVQCLFRAADEVRTDRFDLMALEVLEVGKTWKEADADVAEAIDFLEYYAREMARMGTPKALGNFPGEENLYVYEPKGVGVVISPWNFPLAIPAGMVSAALVTGNCVIFKPSSLSPVLGWKLVEIFHRVGLPPAVLQFVPGNGREVGEYLAGHPGVDFVTFTGSKEIGLRLVKIAGETRPGQAGVKRVIAEMGGKNAIIVDESADLDAAVKGVLESALGFQGQKCSACSRVIVVGDSFGEFLTRLKEAMESVKIGPPEDPRTFMGPVVDEQAVRRIEQYIETGKRDGKAVLVRKAGESGWYVGPVIVSDAAPNSAIAQEEIFGPVVAVMRARDIDEALDLANNTPFALTGGLFSRSPANIRKAESEFRVGNLYINRKITGALVGRQPFGGFGMSGVGSKAGGPDYLIQFTNPKCITENTLRRGFAPKHGSPSWKW